MSNAPPHIAHDDPAHPDHPKHARWVKDTLIEDEHNWLASIGAQSRVTAREVEQAVVSDIERVTRKQEAEQWQREWKARNTNSSRQESAARAADKLGYQYRRAEQFAAEKRAKRCPCEGKFAGCVRCRLEHRIKSIFLMRGLSDNPVIKDLSQRIITQTYTAASWRGEYMGLSSKERDKVLHRRMEDIADQSTGVLGAWR